MIEFNDTSIDKLIFHRISTESDKSIISNKLFETSSREEEEILKGIFLKAFTSSTVTYQFHHEVDLSLNTLLKIAKGIHDDDNFVMKSINIHQHLKSVSKHPNIKDGDLFVVKFAGIKFNNQVCEALGIYKIENKESFIETSASGKGEMGLKFKKGISKKLDKACLILFTDITYTVFIIDNNSKETDYWQNEFIKVSLRNDNINSTSQFLSLAKSFVTDQYPAEFESNKTDQIELLNRSVSYFKEHENFNKKEFEREVLQDKGIIKSFRDFDSDYRDKNQIELADEFEISAYAVKKQAKLFKSILKLDKNFHIYIHGNRELIEQGVEKDGRKYYKIYYKEEN
ncbi:MAG: nucleoid-associated protein [Bacteroidetes bacterium]|nr:nucleoid-associated protein [Bacteroidota bacterium]